MKYIFQSFSTLLLLFLFVSLPIIFSEKNLILSAAEINVGSLLDRRAALEKELQDYENQIKDLNNVIQDKQNQSASLQRDIDVLKAKVAKYKLGIKSLDIQIANLQGGIVEQTALVSSLLKKIDNEESSLKELVKKYYELGDTPLVEIILGYNNLSDFFKNIDSLDSLQEGIQNSLMEIKESKTNAEEKIDVLQVKKAEQLQLKTIQNLEKKRLEEATNEEQQILKGEEARYQKVLTERKKEAAKIRSQLFLLNGSTAIPFEKAIEYANLAYAKTGVRQAFILGIITEESNLGENVGRGDWKTDLSNPKCEKQRTAFVGITDELGLNPDLMPVSKKAWYGNCGGAMGPAQFIPTTWNLYKSAISNVTGNRPPNPWDPKDAFVASALLLKDNGAVRNGREGERQAALKYLAGSNWKKPAYSFYADDVLQFADRYQEQINFLSQS